MRRTRAEEVYVVAAKGGDPVALTKAPGDDSAPCWSPDGSRIAFIVGDWSCM